MPETSKMQGFVASLNCQKRY